MTTNAPMHAWTKHDQPTTCCGRFTDELPLSDGRTTSDKGVTCDGNFTPAVWVHDIYPHPSDRWDDEPPLEDAAKYHAARALALTCSDIDAPGYHDRLLLMLAERTTAWHVAALARGLSGQEALRWVHGHSMDDSQELLYDLCHELGVELHRIKPYALREHDVPGTEKAQTESPA